MIVGTRSDTVQCSEDSLNIWLTYLSFLPAICQGPPPPNTSPVPHHRNTSSPTGHPPSLPHICQSEIWLPGGILSEIINIYTSDPVTELPHSYPHISTVMWEGSDQLLWWWSSEGWEDINPWQEVMRYDESPPRNNLQLGRGTQSSSSLWVHLISNI